jgi:hypothetical protein
MITPCRAAAAVFVWALVLSLLAAAINVLHLTPAATATTDLSADAAKRALGVEALGDVRVSHLRELAALSKFTAVYAHLGRRAEYVSMSKLEGKFEARWLPLGVWRSLLLMGDTGGAMVGGGGGGGGGGAGSVAAWRGQRFVKATRITDAWGDNIYRAGGGQEMRGQGFFVEYDVPSGIDGARGVASLDYGSHGGNGWSLTSAARGEIRCFHENLCIGLSGFWFTGGVRNGMPYVLFRAGADSKRNAKKWQKKKNMKKRNTEARTAAEKEL